MYLATLPTTSLVLAAALVGLGQAAPGASPAQLVPRACVTQYPTLISRVFEINPDQKAVVGDIVEISKQVDGGSSKRYRRDVFVQFDNIPANSYGCQLESVFPAGAFISGTGNNLVNVFAVDRAATPNDTWNTSPKPTFLFGSVTFESKPDQAVQRVINSATCQSTLTYRLSIAFDDAEVYFVEAPQLNQGLRLVHIC